ncbi:MAG: CRISPR-associated endonuclease Cas1 [Candidatus Schekmanbacteria bacterium]|nr:CRISPR-associated endonuclease Cas1 [Candidatus Schekmanbacteria bacterium]
MQLVINTFGASLRKTGDRFVIQAGERSLAVSAKKVQSILIATAACFSTDAIELASQHNIDVIFLDKYGDPYGRVWLPRLGSTAAIRRRQIEIAREPEGLALVRDWIVTKLRNQEEFLDELWRRRPGTDELFAAAVETLRDSRRKLGALTGGIDELRGTIMGIEGSAARAYFQCLGALMPEPYAFSTRSRHPAKDPFNATLNYAYGVLYSMVERACIVAGLDPFVGFLHTDNYNKQSLVFDLIEPFRIIGERTAVLMFTGRRAHQSYFAEIPAGVTISKDGKAALIESLNQRLDRAVRYGVQADKRKRRNVKQRHVVQLEAHALANALIGRRDLPTIVETRELWKEDAEPGAS